MTECTIRDARPADLPTLVQMLADDPLGATREEFSDPLPASYLDAFDAIQDDPGSRLLVAERDGVVVGMLQVTITPYLTHRGGRRATVEGVRVDRGARSGGVGRTLVEQAVAIARERGCHLIQLTTDKSRPDAIRFYESLGFVATHEGMKLRLPPA